MKYTTFGQPDPEADRDTVVTRVAQQEVMLQNVIMPLVGTMYDRVEDQEDALRPFYRKAVQYAQYRNAMAGGELGKFVNRIEANARTRVAGGQNIARLLAASDTIPPGCVWDDKLGVLKCDDAIAVPVPPVLSPGPNPNPCPPGFAIGPPDSDGVQHCIPGIPPIPPRPPLPAPPVPPVPPVPPEPTPLPTPEPPGCTVILSGTIVKPVADQYWVRADCSNCEEVTYEVVKCPCTPPGTVGTSTLGPWAELPTEEQIAAAVAACVSGTSPPVSPPAAPPTSPPPPPPPPGEEPEPEPGEVGEGPDLPAVPPIPDTLDCTLLLWAEPRVCECVDQYVAWFKEVGKWFGNMVAWLADYAKFMNDTEIIKLEAALFRNFLRIVGGKLSYNDPTPFEAARGFQELVRAKFDEKMEDEFSACWRTVRDMHTESTGPFAESLYGCYVTKSLLTFVEDHYSGWLAPKEDGPHLRIEFQQLRQIIDVVIQYVYPVAVPSLPDVEDLWRQGVITDAQAGCLVRLNGQQWPFVKMAWQSRRQQPSADDLIQWNWRERPPRAELDRRLRSIGYLDPRDVDVLERTRAWLPTPSDAIRIGRRDAFDPNKLGRAEMLAEMKEQPGLQELFDAIGLGKTFITTQDGRRVEVNNGELYWLSDYEEASPTQVYEMQHRLRPGRTHLYPLPGPDGKPVFPAPVTIDVVRKLLKEKDYNPIWRDRLAAISYRVIGRIDVRRMYALSVFGKPLGKDGWDATDVANPKPKGPAEKELIERYLDMGSSPADAAVQGLYTSLDFSLGKVRKTQLKKQNAIVRGYKNGTLAAITAKDMLQQVTGSSEVADDLVKLADSDVRNQEVEETTRSVRSMYLSGRITSEEAKTTLTAVGIRPLKIADLMTLWNLRLAGRRKEIAAGQLCGYYAVGLVTKDDFRTRLMRIGYPEAEANRIIRRCELGELAKSAKQIAREEAAARRDRQARERERIRQEEQIARRGEADLKAFLATRPEKHLIGYYKAGVITELGVRDTLALKKFIPADIDRWVTTYLRPIDQQRGGGNGDGS